ncbi:hypothetical protein BN1058_02520 [Paraliobacillus sp. PM-2]|uniref:hypothetical protein n=1 Tax=Paraliobacillus sp. PM-2 TaxID=1462524 RepID=UPI00061C9F28|nr:hypothetical protein [Paraliobacillus sp. PM-2]CQR48171.1 hypothetical protein BN1058_02520 [Paraliobacillus sp. PM-2]
MTRIIKVLTLVFVIALSILVGCSPSEEEALTSVENIAKKQFKSKSMETNQTYEHFSLYVPNGYEIAEVSQSNLILEKDGQTYILFYNALEDTTSKLNYQAAEANGKYQLLQSFKNDQRFGYVKVAELEKDYELQIGIGGVKVTTQTTLADIEEDTQEMMQMANSIAYSE